MMSREVKTLKMELQQIMKGKMGVGSKRLLKGLGTSGMTQNTNVNRFTLNLHGLKIIIVKKLPLKYYSLRCFSF